MVHGLGASATAMASTGVKAVPPRVPLGSELPPPPPPPPFPLDPQAVTAIVRAMERAVLIPMSSSEFLRQRLLIVERRPIIGPAPLASPAESPSRERPESASGER